MNIYAQTNDYSAVPQQLKDQVNERYPSARRAVLRTGGDFPFLSRPDEVNLYLQLHLRRVGVEPRPDLVQGFTRDGSSGSSKDHKDGDSFDDRPRDNGNRGSGGDDREMRHSGSESHDSDEPIPTSTLLANTVLGAVSSTLYASLCMLMIQHYYASALYNSSSRTINVSNSESPILPQNRIGLVEYRES